MGDLTAEPQERKREGARPYRQSWPPRADRCSPLQEWWVTFWNLKDQMKEGRYSVVE